ncbi:MAG: glycoside hydrolase family 3 C-terminal domain-containing protein [Ruminiclostridium sp.]|nr:glycoside hydrolase family 3 C-terminal domain-containing protein [Ruminiclostridium sp.]
MEKFENRAREIVSQLTADEKLGMLTTHHNAVERLGLGEFWIGTEVARGYVGREPEKISTVFPQPIGLAGTFDRELMHELGVIAGTEARAYYNEQKKGGLMLWGPTVDMERDPRWGRTEEAYGEDVFLAGELTAQYTKGMAGETEDGYYMTVPTLKHFCANNNENDRGSSDAFLPPRLKYEYYYAAFENAIRCGGAKSVMTAYNAINGLPAIMNPELETILKEQWGLWFTVSDGGDMSQNVNAHKYCDSMAEAFALSLKGGCDVMTDMEEIVRPAAEKALERGLVTWEDIDRSLTRVIAARLRLGQLSDNCPFDSIDRSVIDCEAHRETNLRAALEQVVLLKNDGILPLKQAPKKIAVVGALADCNLRDWYTGYFTGAVSVCEGIKREFPEAEVVLDKLWDIVAVKAPNGKYLSVHEDGTVWADADVIGESEKFELQEWGEDWSNLFSVKYGKYIRLSDDGTLKLHNDTVYDWFTRETFNIKEEEHGCIIEDFQFHKRLTLGENGSLTFVKKYAAVDENIFDIECTSLGFQRGNALCGECDLVVCCTGNHPVQAAKECYDRTTLAFDDGAWIKDCEKTVMVLISSYPYAVNDENEAMPAILYTSHAGAHLGTAVARTISGSNNPSGHLAMTWYRSELDLPDIHEYDIAKAGTTYMYFEGTPLYPFGHGLSYSDFELGELRIRSTDGGYSAAVAVTNTSDTDGTAVVQIYCSADKESGMVIPLPKRKLCGFERVFVKAGETVNADIAIPGYILRVYDPRSGRMIVESGSRIFSAGLSSADIRVSTAFRVEGETVGARPDSFPAVSFEDSEDIRIFCSRRLGCELVRGSGWAGKLVYGGVRLDSAESVKLRISTLAGHGKVKLEAGDNVVEAEVPVCDAYDDLAEVTVPAAELRGSDTLKISLGEGMSLLDITIIG